jgi:hypothetical protein
MFNGHDPPPRKLPGNGQGGAAVAGALPGGNGVSFATVNHWENGKMVPSKLAQRQFELFCKEKKISLSGLYEMKEN